MGRRAPSRADLIHAAYEARILIRPVPDGDHARWIPPEWAGDRGIIEVDPRVLLTCEVHARIVMEFVAALAGQPELAPHVRPAAGPQLSLVLGGLATPVLRP